MFEIVMGIDDFLIQLVKYCNKIVWHDESDGTPRLTVYDIPSGTRSYITKNVDNSSIPFIYSNIIVWSANGNVYMRDISMHTQNMIALGVDPDAVSYTHLKLPTNRAAETSL